MAPTSTKKPAAKKVVAKKAGPKKAKKGVESYKLYIFKVLKQVHPDTGISSKAMAILNSFIADQFEKIATAAAQVSPTSALVGRGCGRARVKSIPRGCVAADWASAAAAAASVVTPTACACPPCSLPPPSRTPCSCPA